MSKRPNKAERERLAEAERREVDRQVRLLRIRPWEFPIMVPLYTRGQRNPFTVGTAEHTRWARMANFQKRLDERRAKRAALKQGKPEESK
jgi:hypothetical protein